MNAPLARAREAMLSRALAGRDDAAFNILSMHLAPGGNSRETWICDVSFGESRRRIVFRCDPDHWIRPAGMLKEINGLKLATRAGVPAPKVLVSSEEVEIGRPYVVTEFAEGTAIARRIMRDEEYSGARHVFTRQCGEILARLHGAAALAENWKPYDPIADLHTHLASAGHPSPVLQGALHWLIRNRPGAPAEASPVHRDFRIGNLMVGGSGIVAVLDWETCELGEPEEDLAWLCARSWRYGSSLPVGGIGTAEELLDVYQRCSGRTVDMDRLHWWSVYAETRWGLAGIARQRAGSAGDAMEQAAITRRACRQEHNVLLELQRYVVK